LIPVEFRVLGPLEVVEDGRSIPLDRRRMQGLLAYLLLHANELVSSERLIDELWGPQPPKTASASLHNYISQLRRAIGAELVVSRPPGYLLRVDPEGFDLARFDRLVEEARAMPAKERAALLRAALSLWRGAPFEDLAFKLAPAEIAQLAERHLTAIEDRIAAELELGLGAEVIDELERMIAANPLRERLRGQLMLALYRAGRQADALASYRDARRTLNDELGLEPGEDLRALEQAILQQDPGLLGSATLREAPAKSRRTVTVLFCDVADSTQLATALDAEAYRQLISTYFEAARSAIEAHGGTVEKFIGDAVMAVFGVPELHEDDALRAVRAGVDIRDALAKLNEEAAQGWNHKLAVRIAVNTGEVVTSAAGGEALVTGAAVNMAAHLEKRAGANQLLLGRETYELVREAVYAEQVDVGPDLEGWRLDEVIADAPALARRLDTRLVGRQKELRRLRGAFERTCKERSCTVVTVVGEAGIGKTRLARELVASVSDDARVLVGRCVSYGAGATYLPLAEIVRQGAPEASAAGIASLLAGADDADQVARRVAELVGLAEGPATPGEAFWAVRRVFEGLAREQPLVLVLDDVHWAEPTLLDLVEYIGEWCEAPILVLCLARPDLFEARPGWAGPSSTGFVVELEALSAEDVGALVAELAGGSVTPDVRDRIVAHAGGNPLFSEQLLALSSEAPDLPLDQAPPTVEALIGSRLDRLDRGKLDVLRRASVIGRRFTGAEVRALGPVEDADLRGLERAGLVHRTDPESEGGLRFHHVLVRDVAYRGMPKARRAELHEQYGTWLEARAREDEIVGYHFEQAVRYRAELGVVEERRSELAGRAAARLGAAGRAALNRGDVVGAVNLLSRATSLPPLDAPLRLQLLPDLADALSSMGEFGRADQVLADAADRSAAADNAHTGWRVRLQQTWLRFETDPSVEVADVLREAITAVKAFEEFHDDRALAHAWHLIAWVQMTSGRLSALADAVERGLEYARIAGDAMTQEDLTVWALLVGPTGPFPTSQVIANAEAELERARRTGSRRVESAASLVLAMCAAFEGRFDQARGLLSEVTSIDEELGGGRGSGFQYTPAGMIELLAGDVTQAERELRTGYETLRERGDAWFLCGVAAELADVLWLQGQDDEAFELTRVSEETAGTGVLVASMMWRGARAKVLARRGEAEEAETLAREGVAIIEPTDHVLYHADALTDLAQVLRLLNRPEEAAEAAEKARRLYERKGNIAAAELASGLLRKIREGLVASVAKTGKPGRRG
jgi:class 3 adenylate cyclase